MPVVDGIPSISQGATTVSNAVSTAISNTGLVSGMNSLTTIKENIVGMAQSGLTNLGNSVANVAGQIQQFGASLGSVVGQSGSAISNITGLSLNSISNQQNLTNIFQSHYAAINRKQLGGTPPFPNILHNYASYNYIFTLSVLDDYSLNFPDESYKVGNFGPIITRSGSGAPNNRVETDYKTNQNKQGKYDFFIDNVVINSVIALDKATGNSNATGFKFKVYEPYSMGMLYKSLVEAAQKTGHSNHLDLPLLLTVEFVGHLNDVVQNVNAGSLSIEKTTRHFPLRISTVDMRVSGKGAEYEITGYPYNERAFSSTYIELKSDVAIVGKTVHEMLQTGENSLQKVINDRLKEAAVAAKRKVPDQILIYFPVDLASGKYSESQTDQDDRGATVDPNRQQKSTSRLSVEQKLKVSVQSNGTLVQNPIESEMNSIGRSSMGFDPYRSGDTPFSKDDVVYDKEKGIWVRDNIHINPIEGTFRFTQGSDIQNAINQVILMSDYGKYALSKAQLSPTGKVIWWRIEPHVYMIPSEDDLSKTGAKSKLIVYRVVPYGIPASKFIAPNTADPNLEKAKKQAIKQYDYIYTSKNLDILNFEIRYKHNFYQQVNADLGQDSQGIERQKNQGQAATEVKEVSAPPADGIAPSENSNAPPVTRIADKLKFDTSYGGGGSRDTPETIAAKTAHDVFIGIGDMVNVSMTILGDPYYLGDSGMGNYTASASEWENMNADYSIDYQNGEVDILVNFRTPLDFDPAKGAYDFGPTEIVNQFSGLFWVTQCESTFNRGRFTQTLELIRRNGQTQDPKAIQKSASGAILTQEASAITKELSDSSSFSTIQTFDEGSIQKFDEGPDLITDSEGNVSVGPVTE